jgi:hypothetical protein
MSFLATLKRISSRQDLDVLRSNLLFGLFHFLLMSKHFAAWARFGKAGHEVANKQDLGG